MDPRSLPSTLLRLCVIAVLVCSPALLRADNNDVAFYTGDFAAYGGVSYYPGGATAGTFMTYSSMNLNFYFQFSGNITDFQETPYCGLGCLQYYSADINSGTVTFSGYDNQGQNPDYNFTGIIEPGGTLTGQILCDNQGCAWQNEVNISFESTSGTNGWQSSGSLQWMDGNDGSGGGGFGNVQLLTQEASTPEPSSLLLFGSGALGLGGMLWRRAKPGRRS